VHVTDVANLVERVGAIGPVDSAQAAPEAEPAPEGAAAGGG
jgi:hypothetical protein